MKFNLSRYEEELRHLVNIDSGSRCIDGVNTVADWFAKRYAALGWPIETIAAQPDKYGKSIYTWFGNPDDLDLLILCHTDTVFPDNTAKERPFAIDEEGRFTGPGVADMKAGCLMTLHTMEQLVDSVKLSGNIGIFLNGEHELSCPTTRAVIEEKSRNAKVVVSTEPGRANGDYVRQPRKSRVKPRA